MDVIDTQLKCTVTKRQPFSNRGGYIYPQQESNWKNSYEKSDWYRARYTLGARKLLTGDVRFMLHPHSFPDTQFQDVAIAAFNAKLLKC